MQGARKPKKVLYLITKGNWGGAQRHVFDLAVGLDKSRYTPIVVHGQGTLLKERLQKEHISTYEIHDLGRDISFIKELKSAYALFRILRKEKPHTLHLHSPKAGGMGGLLGRLCGVKKIIYTAHGWTFNEDRPYIEKVLIAISSWAIVWLSHVCIVIAHREYEQAIRFPFVPKKKIKLIHNGIETPTYFSKETARKKLIDMYHLSVPQYAVWLGTIAELHPNKGLFYAIGALETLTIPYIYLVCGDGEQKQKLEVYTNKHHLNKKISLLGFVPDAHLYAQAFDIYISSSIKEGLPYTLLEVGGAGVPIISSDVGGIGDIITTEKNGLLVDSKDSRAIAESLMRLVKDKKLQTQYGKEIEKTIETKFTLQIMRAKTYPLY
jgi:glycosyltransferase involved in cell wall biosynthesis